jgi:transposase
MTRIAGHQTIAELERRYEQAKETVEKSHFHAIWLLAKGHEIGEVAELLSFTPRWLRKLIERYNAQGAESLGDLRAKNGAKATLLTSDLLAALRARLESPPPDGGLWSGPKVAAFIAEYHGIKSVHPQRGWDALKKIGYSLQRPRPRHPKAADEAERDAFKKVWRARSPKRPSAIRTCPSKSGPAMSTGSA